MKITVIGTINKDLILPFQGAPIESFGGIFYNISILSHLMESSDEIIPVSYIGEDVQTPIMAVLKEFPNVSTDGLITIDKKNHKVILEYVSPDRRKEKALFNFPSLTWKHVKPFLDSDIIMVNMITGWDIDQKALTKISKQFRKKMYLDIHFLVMDIDKLGRRSPKKLEKIHKWLNSARFIQMNDVEYDIITENENISKVEFFGKHLKPDQVLIVTQGKKGSELIHVDFGKIILKNFEAHKISNIVDATGCGDAFGAAFVYNFLKTESLEESVRFANLVAAANSLLKGTNETPQLTDAMKKIKAGKVK
jgi:hypothetical protein